MKIIFLGSSKFAVNTLQSLIKNREEVVSVVTQPDRKKGRFLHMEPTEVKKIALSAGLPIFQPADINAPESARFLKELAPDLFVILSYGQLLSQDILNIPKLFAINAHASLLPKYRGAAPISWAVIKGERETGVSVMKVEKKMDAGPIILQKKAQVSDGDTAVSLEERLSGIAAEAITEAIDLIEKGDYKLLPQNEKSATFAPKLRKEDGLIDWNNTAQEIASLIRGCFNWPGAFTYYKGKLLKIYEARVLGLKAAGFRLQVNTLPGEIVEVDKHGISVACGNDLLVISKLQIEAKRLMSVQEFISGHRISAGEFFK